MDREAFDNLLASLDSDRERAAEVYLDIRAHLIRIFLWRGCSDPETYADETINRVARKLAAGESVSDLPTYFFGVARMLVKEFHRKRESEQRALQQAPSSEQFSRESEALEQKIACLEECLHGHSDSARATILAYYEGDKQAKIENRRQLARRLNISLNTLRMQVLRLREKLESCVLTCVERSNL